MVSHGLWEIFHEGFASGEWHEYRVLVEANHHHWINGHPTADLVDLDKKG